MKKRVILISFALLFSPLALINANTKQVCSKSNLISNNKIVSNLNEDEENVVENVTQGKQYTDLQTAINEANSEDELHLLSDITASNAEEHYEDDTFLQNIDFPANKELTLDGTKDETSNYTITGYSTSYSTNSNVTIRNINFVGKKAYNDHNPGSSGTCYFNLNGAHLKLEGKVDISDYKHKSKGVFNVGGGSSGNHTTLEINDGFTMHDCASRRGLVYCNGTFDVTMNGGKIYNNCSTCIKGDEWFEGIAFYVNGTNGGTLTMNGGEICDNTARCFKFEDEIETNGTIYLKDGYPTFNMNGGIIRNNLVKRGGAVYVYENSGTHPTINVKGKIQAYGNHGYDENTQQEFDSNFYLGDASHLINITGDLDPETKIGVFTKNKPTEGNVVPLVTNASQRDLNYFFSDDENYCIKYDGAESKLNLYCYTETDPRFTYPVFADGLRYNGEFQQLIKEPGKVTKGGQMLYSLDYVDDIETATWSADPTTIVKKGAGNYNVAYYVEAGGGCDPSELYQYTVHIEKQLMEIIWSEDSFIYNGNPQTIQAKYIKEGQDKPLNLVVSLKQTPGQVVEFKDITTSPDNPYVAVAQQPADEEDFIFPENHSKEYIMRESQEHHEDEGGFVIENDEETGKPVVKVESDIGYDAWTTLYANKVKQEDEHYQDSIKVLKDNKAIGSNDAVSAIYDVKMTDKQQGTEVNPDGTLKLSFAIPKELGNTHDLSIYQIVDGKPTKLDYAFTDDGYITVAASKLGTFVIVHNLKSLLWLIITLSIVGAALIGAYAYVIVKEKQKKTKEGASNE